MEESREFLVRSARQRGCGHFSKAAPSLWPFPLTVLLWRAIHVDDAVDAAAVATREEPRVGVGATAFVTEWRPLRPLLLLLLPHLLLCAFSLGVLAHWTGHWRTRLRDSSPPRRPSRARPISRCKCSAPCPSCFPSPTDRLPPQLTASMAASPMEALFQNCDAANSGSSVVSSFSFCCFAHCPSRTLVLDALEEERRRG